MNPNVQFKFPLLPIFFASLASVFMLLTTYTMSLIFGSSITIFELICIIGAGIFGFLIIYMGESANYFKYKKLFSKYKFTSVQDIIVATNGEYDDFEKIRSQLWKLRRKGRISGFEIKADGTFTFYDKNHFQNEANSANKPKTSEPQQEVTKMENASSTTEKLHIMADLLEKGVITVDDLNADGAELTTSQELAILSDLLKEGTITEKEFQKIKSDILKNL